MELRDYLELIRRHRAVVVGIVVLATASVMAMTAREPQHYEGSATVTVFQDAPAQTQVTAPYEFDGFYTIQAAGLYADQLKGRVNDPSFVARVFDRARANLPTTRLSRTGRVLVAKKVDPSAIVVQYDSVDRDQVASVLSQAMVILKEETASLQADGGLTSIRLRTGEPLIFSYHSSVLMAGMLAAVVSFILTIIAVFVVESAKPRRS